jgi:threonine dehydrogenase-like Zn-dependent dehydrogenase
VVVEATGSPAGFNDALQLTAPRGTLVLKSTYKEPLDFNPAPLVVNEITLIGSRCGPMEKAVALMDASAINPDGLIQKVYKLDEGVAAVKKANEKGTMKILLAMMDND